MKTLSYLLLIIFCMTVSTNHAVADPSISYEISFSEPQAHYIDVRMELRNINKEQLDVKMPVWAPGSYLVREFAKNVEGFSAKSGNSSLAFEKVSKNTWRIQTGKHKDLHIEYRVYAFELSVRTSFVDASHAFISPSGVFMYVDGRIKEPSTVTVRPAKNWTRISTGLEPVKDRSNTFYAPDFDILYDSPLEIGNQDLIHFEAAGVQHEIAMYGGGNYDGEKLSRDMARIVEAETAVFGENPNKRYVFIVHNTSEGGGGLEHLNSTVLGARRLSYADETGYRGFLGLVAHEYFHLWNVKRLRPKALGPFNYDTENYTRSLWIAEGFTAYYDNLILRRTGIYSADYYLGLLNGDITTVENQPGNQIQPLSDASFDAWIKYYRPNENSRNATVSYYDKGALVGMILDLEILGATGGKKGLDEVMRAMYEEYYKKQKRGFTDAEFKNMAEKIAGRSLDKIYQDYIHGTKPIDYDHYLGYAGFYLVDENAGRSVPFLGVSTQMKEGKLTITSVARGSSAWTDGLNVNDEIIAINNYRVSGALDPVSKMTDLDRSITSKKPGDTIRVTISRDGILQTLDVTLKANPFKRFKIVADNDATEDQLIVRRRWLHL